MRQPLWLLSLLFLRIAQANIWNHENIPVERQDLGILAPQILGFDIAWPKLWHKNGVFDQNLGCSGHFDIASEKWAPVTLKIF